MRYKYKVCKGRKVLALSTTLHEAEAEARRVGGRVLPLGRKNPPDPEYDTYLGGGAFSKAYGRPPFQPKDFEGRLIDGGPRGVEAITGIGGMYNANSYDAGKTVLILARKALQAKGQTEALKYLPEITPLRLDGAGGMREYVYTMPLYTQYERALNKGFNQVPELARFLYTCLKKSNTGTGTMLDAADAFEQAVDSEMSYGSTPIDAEIRREMPHIKKVLEAIHNAAVAIGCDKNNNYYGSDMHMGNFALNGDQLILLDPVACDLTQSELDNVWYKNGWAVRPPKKPDGLLYKLLKARKPWPKVELQNKEDSFGKKVIEIQGLLHPLFAQATASTMDGIVSGMKNRQDPLVVFPLAATDPYQPSNFSEAYIVPKSARDAAEQLLTVIEQRWWNRNESAKAREFLENRLKKSNPSRAQHVAQTSTSELKPKNLQVKKSQRLSRTQRKKYLGDLKGEDREARAAEILYRREHRSNKPFVTDKGQPTKHSTHAAAFAKRYGRPPKDTADAAKLAGVPKKVLDEVYARGMAAWQTGHRPGASQHAWAMARVESFLTGGPTSKTADADLAAKVRNPALTGADRQKAAKVISDWRGHARPFEDTPYWSKRFAAVEDVFAKTRPTRPVVLYRNERTDIDNLYSQRFTSWSARSEDVEGFGWGQRRMVWATFPPESILVQVAAFGPKIDRDAMSEVIVRPGTYNIEPWKRYDWNARPPAMAGARQQNPEEDYRGSHRAPSPETGAPLWDLSAVYDDEVYGPRGAQYYGTGEPADRESFVVVRACKGKKDCAVTIYRAVPKSVEGGINEGDWVTISRRYARDHGEGPLYGDYRILSKTVSARDLFTNGDSIHEWGYYPQPKANPERTFIPPPAVAAEARMALDLRAAQPPSNKCCTPVGIARAKQLANRQPVSETTLRRMKAYFDRHAVDAKGKGWKVDSKGWQAWLAWGGDSGREWCEKILRGL